MIPLVAKNLAQKLPEWLGRRLVGLPYVFRLGPAYFRAARSINYAETHDSLYTESELVGNLRHLLNFAVKHTAFYRSFYRKSGFSPESVHTLADWAKVPIVTKADFQAVPINERTVISFGGYTTNTGGTSGQTLAFKLHSHAFAREWAHMHHIWKARGYRPNQLKLTFRGKHFDARHPLRYNAVHNEYIVNASSPMKAVVEAIIALPASTVIRWLHGYPSLVAEFAHACADLPPALLGHFRSRLFGVLLGSEYPAPVYRYVIEKILSTNVVSWYGHSEMAVLARETALGLYETLPTYGYAEAIPVAQTGANRLVCTSLHNRVHPFIRYDTGDLIEPVSQNAGSLAFKIVDGRVGEFIVDRNGFKHSLTAVIHGRHHAAFSIIKHIQVRQDQIGRVTFLVTPLDSRQDLAAIESGLDFKDLDLDWQVVLLAEPVRTSAGKIKLMVNTV